MLPLLTAFTRHVQKRMLAAQLENRRAVAAISGQVPEALHNLRTLRVLGLEDYMETRYDRRLGESYAAVEKTNFYDAIYSPVVLVLNAAVVGAAMLLSASGDTRILTLFGMSVGTAVTIIGYISRIFAPIESLGMEIQTIQSAMAGVKRIDAFLAQPERDIPAPRSEKMSPRGDVVLSHVTFGYSERTVLSDLSFTMKAGEQITLGDERISRTMAENAARLAGLDAVIRALPQGYDANCSDRLFSQGEWQLLSIARAAAADPAVLLLDEITADLDAETEARVLDALRRASEGRTVLSISHRVYESLGGRTIRIGAQEV